MSRAQSTCVATHATGLCHRRRRRRTVRGAVVPRAAADADERAPPPPPPLAPSRRAMLTAAIGTSILVAAPPPQGAEASPVRASTRAAERVAAKVPTPRVVGPGYATLRDASNYHGLATAARDRKGLSGLLF